MAGHVMLLLRAVRWTPVGLLLAAVAVALLVVEDRATAVGGLAVALPFGVAWLVDDPASALTAGARWGRGPQLAARCSAAAALAAGAWLAAVAWAGGAPPYSGVVLVALLPVALAAAAAWGAAYGGPAAAGVWLLGQVPPPAWRVTGREWWAVAALGAVALWLAARDPVRR